MTIPRTDEWFPSGEWKNASFPLLGGGDWEPPQSLVKSGESAT